VRPWTTASGSKRFGSCHRDRRSWTQTRRRQSVFATEFHPTLRFFCRGKRHRDPRGQVLRPVGFTDEARSWRRLQLVHHKQGEAEDSKGDADGVYEIDDCAAFFLLGPAACPLFRRSAMLFLHLSGHDADAR
jgi:hypothetical protein